MKAKTLYLVYPPDHIQGKQDFTKCHTWNRAVSVAFKLGGSIVSEENGVFTRFWDTSSGKVRRIA